MEVNLTGGERIRVWRERSGSPLVYEAFYEAVRQYRNFARETHRHALQLLQKALTVNPNYTPAMFLYGLTLVDQARFGWTEDRAAAFYESLQYAERALAIDPDYGEAYTVISYARSFQRRHDETVEAAEMAVTLSYVLYFMMALIQSIVFLCELCVLCGFF